MDFEWKASSIKKKTYVIEVINIHWYRVRWPRFQSFIIKHEPKTARTFEADLDESAATLLATKWNFVQLK